MLFLRLSSYIFTVAMGYGLLVLLPIYAKGEEGVEGKPSLLEWVLISGV